MESGKILVTPPPPKKKFDLYERRFVSFAVACCFQKYRNFDETICPAEGLELREKKLRIKLKQILQF